MVWVGIALLLVLAVVVIDAVTPHQEEDEPDDALSDDTWEDLTDY